MNATKQWIIASRLPVARTVDGPNSQRVGKCLPNSPTPSSLIDVHLENIC